jgi:flagellar hook-length control protein FliK
MPVDAAETGQQSNFADDTGSGHEHPQGDTPSDGGERMAGHAALSTTETAQRTDRPLSSAAAGTPAEQVALRIAAAAKNRLGQIRIELRPESLGRLDVRLDFGRDGHLTALIIAENREALDVLRSDARALQQALAGAGFAADDGSLSFQLRDPGTGQQQGRTPTPGRTGPIATPSVATEPATPSTNATVSGREAFLAGNGRLDIRA